MVIEYKFIDKCGDGVRLRDGDEYSIYYSFSIIEPEDNTRVAQ